MNEIEQLRAENVKLNAEVELAKEDRAFAVAGLESWRNEATQLRAEVERLKAKRCEWKSIMPYPDDRPARCALTEGHNGNHEWEPYSHAANGTEAEIDAVRIEAKTEPAQTSCAFPNCDCPGDEPVCDDAPVPKKTTETHCARELGMKVVDLR